MSENNEILEITDANFDEITGEGISLVDFWAPWCYPCRIQGPILDKVAGRVSKRARICKMNVDENQAIAGKLGISGIPTLMIFKQGEMVEQFVGVQQEDALVSALEALM